MMRSFFASAGLLLSFGFPGAGQDRGKDELSPEEQSRLQESLQELDEAQGALARLLDRLDRKSFDVSECAKSLAQDPQACFRFVRNRTSLEPYRGLLRGAQGTLVSRAGNSLDRALLLAELLRDPKREVRLVRGLLSVEHARELLRTEVRTLPSESSKEEPLTLDRLAQELKWDRDRLNQIKSKVDSGQTESRKTWRLDLPKTSGTWKAR